MVETPAEWYFGGQSGNRRDVAAWLVCRRAARHDSIFVPFVPPAARGCPGMDRGSRIGAPPRGPARPLSLSMCVSPRNLPRPRATCLVLSTCHWPICRAGSENSLRGDNRSCWFARRIADPPRRRRSYSPRAYGMSPSFVAEQTGGIGKDGRSNSVGVNADD